MASQAGTLITSISARVRDANNTAHSVAFVRDLLDRAQVLINSFAQSILVEESLSTTARQTLYTVESDLSSTIDVVGVRVDNAPLDRVKPWQRLSGIDRAWHSRTDENSTAWATIGRSLLALYPAPRVAGTVTTIGSKITNTLTDNTTLLEIDEEQETLAMNLVQAMLLVRQRDLDQVPSILKELTTKLNIQLPGELS